MGSTKSKRAELLKPLLPLINSGKYDEVDGYTVFGTSSVWEMIEELTASPSGREEHTLEDAGIRLVSDSKLHDGWGQITGRVSLDQPPAFETGALEGLTPEQTRTFQTALERVFTEGKADRKLGTTVSMAGDEDAIDAAFAEELLEKLPGVVSRAKSLDTLNLDHIPDDDVRRYFREAHRCYLYGFNLACAVLSRAILESALRKRYSTDGPPRKGAVVREPNFCALIQMANADGLFRNVPKEWADDVRKAGNDAIHDLLKFEQRWETRLDEVLLYTRKVLEDLCAS